MGSALFVAFLLAAKFQRIISEPVVHLARTMMTVSAKQNYAIRAEKQSQDELGALIDGFNAMLAQIQVRDEALEEHREHLEQQVAMRTSELSQANRELEQIVREVEGIPALRTIRLETAPPERDPGPAHASNVGLVGRPERLDRSEASIGSSRYSCPQHRRFGAQQ